MRPVGLDDPEVGAVMRDAGWRSGRQGVTLVNRTVIPKLVKTAICVSTREIQPLPNRCKSDAAADPPDLVALPTASAPPPTRWNLVDPGLLPILRSDDEMALAQT